MRCSTCGRFMKLVATLTWETDRYVPDSEWKCRRCDTDFDFRGQWLA